MGIWRKEGVAVIIRPVSKLPYLLIFLDTERFRCWNPAVKQHLLMLTALILTPNASFPPSRGIAHTVRAINSTKWTEMRVAKLRPVDERDVWVLELFNEVDRVDNVKASSFCYIIE